jgi:hypothetical protein
MLYCDTDRSLGAAGCGGFSGFYMVIVASNTTGKPKFVVCPAFCHGIFCRVPRRRCTAKCRTHGKIGFFVCFRDDTR